MAGPKGVICKDYGKYPWIFVGLDGTWTDEMCANECNNNPRCVEAIKFDLFFSKACQIYRDVGCDTYVVI